MDIESLNTAADRISREMDKNTTKCSGYNLGLMDALRIINGLISEEINKQKINTNNT